MTVITDFQPGRKLISSLFSLLPLKENKGVHKFKIHIDKIALILPLSQYSVGDVKRLVLMREQELSTPLTLKPCTFAHRSICSTSMSHLDCKLQCKVITGKIICKSSVSTQDLLRQRSREFSSGYGSKLTSIMIPHSTRLNRCGHYIDQRPASNMDPYLVTALLVSTTLGVPLRAAAHNGGGNGHGSIGPRPVEQGELYLQSSPVQKMCQLDGCVSALVLLTAHESGESPTPLHIPADTVE